MAVLSQLLSDDYIQVCSDNLTRAGEKFISFSGNITSVAFLMLKFGLPTGTGYCRVYKVGDGSLLGTIGNIDVSTISSITPTVYTFNSTPVNVASSDNIYVVFEFTGGTLGVNEIRYRGKSGSPTGGNEYYYTSSWLSYATYDAYYSVTYTPSSVSSGIQALPLGLFQQR